MGGQWWTMVNQSDDNGWWAFDPVLVCRWMAQLPVTGSSVKQRLLELDGRWATNSRSSLGISKSLLRQYHDMPSLGASYGLTNEPWSKPLTIRTNHIMSHHSTITSYKFNPPLFQRWVKPWWVKHSSNHWWLRQRWGLCGGLDLPEWSLSATFQRLFVNMNHHYLKSHWLKLRWYSPPSNIAFHTNQLSQLFTGLTYSAHVDFGQSATAPRQGCISCFLKIRVPKKWLFYW